MTKHLRHTLLFVSKFAALLNDVWKRHRHLQSTARLSQYQNFDCIVIRANKPPIYRIRSSQILTKNTSFPSHPQPNCVAKNCHLRYTRSSKFSVDMVMGENVENLNPKLYRKIDERDITADDEDENVVDEFDAREIFDLIKNINDPEHPLSLEELHVVEQSLIEVDNEKGSVNVQFTPTIPHCSMATLIGLSIRVQLLRALPKRFKVNVSITPGTHNSESAVNKQLADKERVAAATENNHLISVINQCVSIKV